MNLDKFKFNLMKRTIPGNTARVEYLLAMRPISIICSTVNKSLASETQLAASLRSLSTERGA